MFERVKHRLVKSLEEFNYSIDSFKDWISLYRTLKNSKVRYRVPFDKNQRVFSQGHKKSHVLWYVL